MLKKTKTILFGTVYTIKLSTEIHVLSSINKSSGERTDFVNKVVSLGVVLESTLFRVAQVNHLIRKVKNQAHFLPEKGYTHNAVQKAALLTVYVFQNGDFPRLLYRIMKIKKSPILNFFKPFLPTGLFIVS